MHKKKILNLKAEKKLKKRKDKEGFGKNIKDKKCPKVILNLLNIKNDEQNKD